LAKAIARGGKLEGLVKESAAVDAELQAARLEKANVESQEHETGDFQSCDDVAARLPEAMALLAKTSFEFADLLRRAIPSFVIHPVQDLDCPQVRPRAKLRLQLEPWTAPGELPQEHSITLDLFEPPQHLKHLAACVAIKQAQPKASLNVIAAQLGINRMTVKRALAYHRLMQEAGVTDPFRELQDKPPKASRWKDGPETKARLSA